MAKVEFAASRKQDTISRLLGRPISLLEKLDGICEACGTSLDLAKAQCSMRVTGSMKYVVAVIQPHLLDAVREALASIGVVAMTASDVGGTGRQRGKPEIYRGAEYNPEMTTKVQIEIALSDDLAERAVEVICETANTEAIGAGKVFTLDLDDALRIRTGETGEAALGNPV